MRNVVLLTGASGRIGPHVVNALCASNVRIRAVGLGVMPMGNWTDFEWVECDLVNADEVKYAQLLNGVSVVIHLAAELWSVDKMDEVNISVTGRLAKAAERAGVIRFIYASSICVYGMPGVVYVDEDVGLLDPSGSLRYPYAGADFLHKYAISKLGGEVVAKRELKCTQLVVLRFASVYDDKQLVDLGGEKFIKKIWRAARHSHAVYVKNIADVVVSFSFGRISPGCGIYNVSEDAWGKNTFGEFFSALSGAGIYVWVSKFLRRFLYALECLLEAVRYRSFNLGKPLGQIVFSSDKLLATGYRFPYSVAEVVNLAKKMDK